jgi:hypothetical protein
MVPMRRTKNVTNTRNYQVLRLCMKVSRLSAFRSCIAIPGGRDSYGDLARHLDIVLVDPGDFCHVDGM